MPHLNPFAIVTLITALSCLFVAVIFLIYGKNFLHRMWALFNLSIAGWAIFVIFAVTTSSPDKSYRFWQCAHVSGIYVSIFFFHAVSLFCQSKNQRFIFLSYLYGLLHNFLNLYNNGFLINTKVNYLFNSMFYLEMKTSTFFPLMSIWFLLAIIGNQMLYKFYKQDPKQNKDANFLFIGGVIGYAGGITTFLPMLGFHNFYPITVILVAFYALICTYAIFKHELLELRIIYQKSIIYSLLIAIVSILYLLIVVFLEKFLQTAIGYHSVTTSIITAFLLGILIIPLRNVIQLYVDRVFFKGSPIEISEQNELLRQEVAHSEKLKAVATLASGMAHEIRNPLTAIKTFAEYLPTKKDDPEFLEKFSKIVGGEVDRIDGLVKQLLEFAKPSPPMLKDTNIQQLIDDTLNLLNNQLIKHKIYLTKEFEADKSLMLKIDSNQIRQALLNIFLNAIEAMGSGGNLTVVTQTTTGKSFEIRIRDTGGGIPSKDLPHIFDPFFSKKDGGTGLGLAITHQIIDEHKGKIIVKSEVEKGTEFVIEMPFEGLG